MPFDNAITGSYVAAVPSSTSLSLLQRLKDQDSEVWGRLVDLYGPLVFLWCRRLGLNREDAKDVAQEVWVAVAANIGSFRRQRPKTASAAT